MSSIITVENLSKKYILGHQSSERYVALRDVLTNSAKNIFNKLKHPLGGHDQNDPHYEEFYALKDISFEINQGERIGVIGRNGAGKSTLLKILSRITEPTSGKIKIKGRVASLLEVGTGFHPELTGRENIFLNGAILGMSKFEIKKKFDEIVAFAEVEKFLDIPVKRYSSGMYVRLAFAVAAHLEPEILIVDEVLAVGDAQFQKKCMGKMEDVSKNEGRTILFVSHNINAIQNLCARSLMLEFGRITLDSDTQSVVSKYLQGVESISKVILSSRTDRTGTGKIFFNTINLQNENKTETDVFYCGQNIKLLLEYTNTTNQDLSNLHIDIGLDNSFGSRITWLSTTVIKNFPAVISKDRTQIEISIMRLNLTPGQYSFTIYSTLNGEVTDWIRNACTFMVKSADFYGTGEIVNVPQGDFLMDYGFKVV
jgi:lipopolysaccharide transport system ATP-binding protein